MTSAPDEPTAPPTAPNLKLLGLAAIPLALGVILALSLAIRVATTSDDDDAPPPATPTSTSSATALTTPSPTPQATPAASPPPAAEGDLPSGWDGPDDGPITPDAELPQGDVDALLRVTATGEAAASACTADEVTYELAGFDAAAGHRFATLLVRNSSARECTVSGYLGIGGRGEWGHAFELEAEQGPVNGEGEEASTVRLAPGEAAQAWLEWTGGLAGAQQEHLSSFALQLAAGQPAAMVAAAGPGGTPLDVGMFSTVRIGPLRPFGA